MNLGPTKLSLCCIFRSTGKGAHHTRLLRLECLCQWEPPMTQFAHHVFSSFCSALGMAMAFPRPQSEHKLPSKPGN